MQIQFLRGNTALNQNYVGPEGSITIDTELGRIHVHDGTTPGGWVVPNMSVLEDINDFIQDLDVSKIQGLEELLEGYVTTDKLGVAEGVATLDESGKVPSAQLPSYVDDVEEYDVKEDAGVGQTAFPSEGEKGKIYVEVSTGKVYRWSGSAYIEISASPGSTDAVTEGSVNLYFTEERARDALSAAGDLQYDPETGVFSFTESVKSVNGKTGEVVLDKTDIGLGNVENYAMASQADAEAATAADKYMSPLRVRNFIEAVGFEQDDVTGEWFIDQGAVPAGEE